MTPDESDWLLARMSIAWSGKMLNVEEVRFWIEKLRPYDLEESIQALNRLEDTFKFWPSCAEFKTAIKAVQNSHEKNFTELQPVQRVASKEDALRFIEEIRKTRFNKRV